MPSPTLQFRVSPEVKERVAIVARHHGRTVTEELKLAWSIFDTMATLDALQDDEVKADLGAEYPAAVAKVKAELRDLTRRAFRPDPLLDSDDASPTLN